MGHWSQTEINTFANFLRNNGVEIVEVRRYMSGDVEFSVRVPVSKPRGWFDAQIKQFDKTRTVANE